MLDYNSSYMFGPAVGPSSGRSLNRWSVQLIMLSIYKILYRVYQNDWSGLEVDYIHKFGEETYKY